MYQQWTQNKPTLYQVMRGITERFQNAPAFRQNGKNGIITLDYIEFEKRARAMAAYIDARYPAKAHIALLSRGCVEFIIAFFGITLSGRVAVLMDVEATDVELCRQVVHSDAVACLYQQPLEKRAEMLARECGAQVPYLPLESEADAGGAFDGSEPDFDAVAMSDPAALFYTSGTTGMGKGVMLSQENLACVACQAGEHVDVYESVVSILPVHHTYGLVCGNLSIYGLGKTVCYARSLKTFIADVKTFAPSNLFLVPMFLSTMHKMIWANAAKSGKDKLLARMVKVSNALLKLHIDLRRTFFKSVHAAFGGNLKTITCGGAPLDPELAHRFEELGFQVLNGYGITECSPLVAVNYSKRNRPGTVGPALPYNEISIRNADAESRGEVCVRGRNVMLGYYKNEEATRSAFTEDGWFRTGDIGTLTDEGCLVITGRIKDIIVLHNGEKVYPEEIETLLYRLPYVCEAAVYPIYTETHKQGAIAAEIYPEEGADLSSLEADVAAINKLLPVFKRIVKTIVRDAEFEKTSTKKIKRFAINKGEQHV